MWPSSLAGGRVSSEAVLVISPASIPSPGSNGRAVGSFLGFSTTREGAVDGHIGDWVSK